ncbi:MAG TPA: hypothetical protein DFS52_32120 [Myxococcales bacterium]|mgnify:CR=1 FL=1|jgi:hypothetical protein|nr:hypothetical protein [Myxococcales bacterium]
MVFGWLFGEKKRQETSTSDARALQAQADEATNAHDVARGESLCRELVRLAPDNADAWNMLGVNLIRRDAADPQTRAEAVVTWMRALALRPGDSRAADHLQAELQFPDELIPSLIDSLEKPAPSGDDAAAVLAQLGAKAKPALSEAAARQGRVAERARSLLETLG